MGILAGIKAYTYLMKQNRKEVKRLKIRRFQMKLKRRFLKLAKRINFQAAIEKEVAEERKELIKDIIVIQDLDHNIKFERNEELFPYEFNGEQHKYKPDFIENGVYIEIKGYFTEQVKAKELAFPFQLKYLDINGIKPYIDYVEKMYGKDYIRLYNKE